MNNAEDKVGMLFIHESDGTAWTKYTMNLIESEPYKIRCLSSLYCDLNKELTQRCSVLVLIFTPDMEDMASSLDFDLLQPNSPRSCIIECNGEVNKTNMPQWRVMYTLEETLESQRAVLTRLIDLYEEVTGNKDDVNVDTDSVLILDVVPAVLYPGQKEIYVMFNYEESAKITVSIEDVTDRLSTRKCTKTVHVFDMPDTGTGQKNVNIFVGDQEDPIFSTNILIMTAENLADSLTFNLRRILCATDPSEPTASSEGVYVDPFSETYCTDATLNKCWLTLKELLETGCDTKKPKVKDKVSAEVEVGAEEKPDEKPEVNEPETVTEKDGMLFIHESDGTPITKYMMKIIESEPYNIRCISSLYCDLNKELTQRCSVLVLIFTPDMEDMASSLDFDLLQPNSPRSCIIECNGEVNKTNMPQWRVMYTLEERLGNRQAVVTGLSELYGGVVSVILRSEPKVEEKPEVHEPETGTVLTRKRMPSKMNKVKNFFQKVLGNTSKFEVSNTVTNRKSRRIMLAKSQQMKGRPRLPVKYSRQT